MSPIFHFPEEIRDYIWNHYSNLDITTRIALGIPPRKLSFRENTSLIQRIEKQTSEFHSLQNNILRFIYYSYITFRIHPSRTIMTIHVHMDQHTVVTLDHYRHGHLYDSHIHKMSPDFLSIDSKFFTYS